MDWIDILRNDGLNTLSILACGWFIYINVKRDRDESIKREEAHRLETKDREEAHRLETKERDERFIDTINQLSDTNKEYSESLNKIADTIEQSNNTNRELGECNRLLVEKVSSDIVSIGNDLSKIKDKLELV